MVWAVRCHADRRRSVFVWLLASWYSERAEVRGCWVGVVCFRDGDERRVSVLKDGVGLSIFHQPGCCFVARLTKNGMDLSIY